MGVGHSFNPWRIFSPSPPEIKFFMQYRHLMSDRNKCISLFMVDQGLHFAYWTVLTPKSTLVFYFFFSFGTP